MTIAGHGSVARKRGYLDQVTTADKVAALEALLERVRKNAADPCLHEEQACVGRPGDRAESMNVALAQQTHNSSGSGGASEKRRRTIERWLVESSALEDTFDEGWDSWNETPSKGKM